MRSPFGPRRSLRSVAIVLAMVMPTSALADDAWQFDRHDGGFDAFIGTDAGFLSYTCTTEENRLDYGFNMTELSDKEAGSVLAAVDRKAPLLVTVNVAKPLQYHPTNFELYHDGFAVTLRDKDASHLVNQFSYFETMTFALDGGHGKQLAVTTFRIDPSFNVLERAVDRGCKLR